MLVGVSLVKMQHCWKSHVVAHLMIFYPCHADFYVLLLYFYLLTFIIPVVSMHIQP